MVPGLLFGVLMDFLALNPRADVVGLPRSDAIVAQLLHTMATGVLDRRLMLREKFTEPESVIAWLTGDDVVTAVSPEAAATAGPIDLCASSLGRLLKLWDLLHHTGHWVDSGALIRLVADRCRSRGADAPLTLLAVGRLAKQVRSAAKVWSVYTPPP